MKKTDILEFIHSLSEARFNTYLTVSQNDKYKAYKLYRHNLELSKEFYIVWNAWEITLRNKIDEALTLEFGINWFQEPRFLFHVDKFHKEKIQQIITKQMRARKSSKITEGMLIADSTASFWVQLLVESKWVHFKYQNTDWGKRIIKSEMTVKEFHRISEEVLKIRNRIAHHEPIFQLKNLEQIYDNCLIAINHMCPATANHISKTSRFKKVIAA